MTSATPAARAYGWYVVSILTLANMSLFIDRQVMSFLVDPIKRDLGLSDTGVSILLGLAFALFNAVLGFPIGRLADTRSRRAIIGWGVAVWSVMCVACGLARNAGQLFVARVGVGVGEAALLPPAFSLIADLFPPERLASAMSVLSAGTFIGSGLAYLIGGTVVQAVQQRPDWHLPVLGTIRSWQAVFILVGAAGLVIPPLMFTVREPRRLYSATARPPVFPIRQTFDFIRRNLAAFVTQGTGSAVFSLVNYGTALWFPVFFMRVHGWSVGEVGLYMGLATIVFGTLGVVAGGWLAGWLLRRGRPAANIEVGIVASVLALVAAFPLYLTSNFSVLMAGLVLTNIAAAAPFGAAAAAVQDMTPAPMRGQTSALFLFLLTAIGLGFGPLVVALFTDHVFHGDQFVGRSLLTVTVLGRALSGIAFALGLDPFVRSVAAAAAWRPGAA